MSGASLEAATAAPEVRERMGRVERLSALALAAGAAVLADAGLPPARRERAGVVVGTAFGCFLTNADYQRRLADGGVGAASPRLFAATVSNAAAGELGIACGLAGPGVTVSAGVASGTLAIGHAAALITAGDANVLLAGGVDASGPALDAFLGAGGFAVGALVAEAAAFVTLEPLGAATVRGARVRGHVLAHGAGFEPDVASSEAGEALAAVVAQVRAAAGGGSVAVVSAAPPAAARVVERALGAVAPDATHLAFDVSLGHSLAAAGPRALLHVLETGAPGTTALVVDACPSGHVAALAVRIGDGA